MSKRMGLAVILALPLAMLVGALAAAPPDPKEVPAAVLEPAEGAKVEQSSEVIGEVLVPGWPVVLVKPLAGDQLWWVQSPVEEVRGGRFTTPVLFGNDETKSGTQFRIVILVAKTKDEAMKFERGQTKGALPPGLPRSEQVTVMRA